MPLADQLDTPPRALFGLIGSGGRNDFAVLSHSVHSASCHYAWAERAKTVGDPERFAQEALGHSSKAVHRACAKRALMKIPSLEDYEQRAVSKTKLVA